MNLLRRLPGHPPQRRRLLWRVLRPCQGPANLLGRTNPSYLASPWPGSWASFFVQCFFHKVTPGWRLSHEPMTSGGQEAILVLAGRWKLQLPRVLVLIRNCTGRNGG